MKLVVRYSPHYPPDRCWMWEVTDGWRKFQGWRPTYPEAAELGLEDLARAAREAEAEALIQRALSERLAG